MKTIRLAINESYWDLKTKQDLKEQVFLVQESLNLNTSILNMHSNLVSLMKEKDINKEAKYGLEIKTNGSSRSARIPIVRISDKISSIWKIVKTIKDIDKGVIVLNDLVYHLKNTNPKGQLPKKILLVLEEEKNYITKKNLCSFIKEKVSENDLIFISQDFIQKIIKGEDINFDKLIEDDSSIFTQTPIK